MSQAGTNEIDDGQDHCVEANGTHEGPRRRLFTGSRGSSTSSFDGRRYRRLEAVFIFF
jgi:hypothetical protein